MIEPVSEERAVIEPGKFILRETITDYDHTPIAGTDHPAEFSELLAAEHECPWHECCGAEFGPKVVLSDCRTSILALIEATCGRPRAEKRVEDAVG
jgi:hypothetical protein